MYKDLIIGYLPLIIREISVGIWLWTIGESKLIKSNLLRSIQDLLLAILIKKKTKNLQMILLKK